MTAPRDPSVDAAAARRLLRGQDSGVLSTQSAQMPGYPFGSVTPYVMTHTGQVAVFVSGIAQHTANMRADPKVCLTVAEQGDGNSQALGRVTLIGDAASVPEDAAGELRERYFALFPEARDYGQAHPFEFFAIEPLRVRHIAGFGQIFWVEPEAWSLPAPDWVGQEAGILEHMNSDHGDALRSMAHQNGAPDADSTRMVAVDVEGCHLQAGEVRLYLPFGTPANSMDEVRSAMIELARPR